MKVFAVIVGNLPGATVVYNEGQASVGVTVPSDNLLGISSKLNNNLTKLLVSIHIFAKEIVFSE